MEILVKYPTRSRPDKFLKNLDGYIKTSTSNLTFIISMDDDDKTMNNQDMIDKIKSRKSDRVNILCFYNESKGKVNAINRDIPIEGWDILIATADDMIPFQDWDKVILEDFSDGNLFKCVSYNTDPRIDTPESLITLPIIGKKLYDYFGYIYHSDYKSEHCDGEQTRVYKKLGAFVYKDKHPFFHDWFNNQDELMKKNMKYGYEKDENTFKKREKLGFPK